MPTAMSNTPTPNTAFLLLLSSCSFFNSGISPLSRGNSKAYLEEIKQEGSPSPHLLVGNSFFFSSPKRSGLPHVVPIHQDNHIFPISICLPSLKKDQRGFRSEQAEILFKKLKWCLGFAVSPNRHSHPLEERNLMLKAV